MSEIKPRYEFRAFAQHFGRVEEKIRQLSELVRFRESNEIYLISVVNDKKNIKIRYDTLDIKAFVREEKGLQQWRPHLKTEFPLPAAVIRDEVMACLGVAIPQLNQSEYTLAQFLEDIIQPHPELVLAKVFKRRFGYTINGCISELAELLVNGAAIKTVAVESEDVAAVLKAMQMIGLQEYENVNYILAIKRILGLAPIGG
jgi:exopolyphosphatase/guanosine-5'-triphosphate,3'-diphosphate pyrophosphatase